MGTPIKKSKFWEYFTRNEWWDHHDNLKTKTWYLIAYHIWPNYADCIPLSLCPKAPTRNASVRRQVGYVVLDGQKIELVFSFKWDVNDANTQTQLRLWWNQTVKLESAKKSELDWKRFSCIMLKQMCTTRYVALAVHMSTHWACGIFQTQGQTVDRGTLLKRSSQKQQKLRPMHIQTKHFLQ